MVGTLDLNELTFFRGRVALHAILKSLGVGKGDEAAIQAFTCIAVPEAVMASQAMPIYIDVEPGSFNMDPADLARKITHQTKAVVVQHTFGIPADMDRIVDIASKMHIPIIEDCCHTLRGTYKGRPLGSFGVASFYSFEWGKPVVIGIGGSAILNDRELSDKMVETYSRYCAPGLGTVAKIQLQYYAVSLFYSLALYWRMGSPCSHR